MAARSSEQPALACGQQPQCAGPRRRGPSAAHTLGARGIGPAARRSLAPSACVPPPGARGRGPGYPAQGGGTGRGLPLWRRRAASARRRAGGASPCGAVLAVAFPGGRERRPRRGGPAASERPPARMGAATPAARLPTVAGHRRPMRGTPGRGGLRPDWRAQPAHGATRGWVGLSRRARCP
jgi:hypothetical protein